jgi:hypothetical protein
MTYAILIVFYTLRSNAMHLKCRLGDIKIDCRDRLHAWRLRNVRGLTACNLINEIHDVMPHIGILDLRECFCEREAICRANKIGHVGRRRSIASRFQLAWRTLKEVRDSDLQNT